MRKTIDCLIATFCIREQHSLIHRGRDFDPFERFLQLSIVHPVGVPGSDRRSDALIAFVTDAFLPTLGIPLVAGSGFQRQNQPDDRPAVILSESLARALFGERSPVGQAIRVGTDSREQPHQVIGVAADAVLVSPQDRNPRAVYVNYWQMDVATQVYPTLLVRVAGEAGPAMPMIERAVRDAGHEYVLAAEPLIRIRDGSLMQERLLAFLATAFALLGLALVGVGLYGLLAFSVAQRTLEIAVRMALGATRGRVARLLIRHTLVLVGTGVLLGVPIAWLVTKMAAALLYSRESIDVSPIAIAVGLIIAIAMAAAAAPATRACLVNPMPALRRE